MHSRESLDWEAVRPTNTLVPPYSVFRRQIQISENDERQYRLIELQNGLQAMIIHDANTDKAAASLDVAVGHLHDPDDMPGLAHFCEHLLFMGTEQHPKENEYSEYLAKNNGSANAFTVTTNTNYHFLVAHDALAGALERFAGFFHSPLFLPACTSREINAVDSEHKKNNQNDLWRMYQVNKHLSKEGHVWRKFGSGNRYSLSKAANSLHDEGKLLPKTSEDHLTASTTCCSISPATSSLSVTNDYDADGGVVGQEVRRRLVEWWSREYCSSRMRVCIIGRDSLDYLSELASLSFSPVRNRGQDSLPSFHDHPFGENEKGTIVRAKTVMSVHVVDISFPLEYAPLRWREKPGQFIADLVGHEGPGSLHSYLKKRGWLTALTAGVQDLARGFSMFAVTLHLTEDGFKNQRDAVLAVFKYLSLLRSYEFESFRQDECVTLAQMNLRFQEKMRADEYATSISTKMAWPMPRDYLIVGSKLCWPWDETSPHCGWKKIKEYLETFRADQGRVIVMAQGSAHMKLNPKLSWNKEPWYGTEYCVEKLDADFMQEAENENDIPDFHLPGKNEFIPSDFSVDKQPVSQPLKRPYLIRDTPMLSLWHKKDDQFWMPKARIAIDIRSPRSNMSPRTNVLTKLYSDIITDSLTEFAYDAELAGLTYNVEHQAQGLLITLRGFNDKMSVFVDHVLAKVKALAADPSRVAVIKEKIKRAWQNYYLGQSYHLSDYYLRYLLVHQQWTLEEKIAEIDTISAEEIREHIKGLLGEARVRTLVVGNFSRSEAVETAEVIGSGLDVARLSETELTGRAFLLPKGSNYIWSRLVPNPNQSNSSVSYYLQFGSVTDQHLRVTSSLLRQIVKEPTFDTLRTKEQLGYVVLCSDWKLPDSSVLGIRILVQSEKPTSYVESRIEAFLDDMQSRIQNMTAMEFQSHKDSLRKAWTEVDKNLSDEESRYLVQITSGQLDFHRHENDARFLETVTKQDVLELFNTRVHPTSPLRSKLSVHMVSQKAQPIVSTAAMEASFARVYEACPEAQSATQGFMARAGEITLSEFRQECERILGDFDGKDQLLSDLPTLVDQHPWNAKQHHISYINDVRTFKEGLKMSTPPGPMVRWPDFPESRL